MAEIEKCPHCGMDINAKPKPDRRVWMYRQDEARIFENPESVPEGEGWVTHPSQILENNMLAADHEAAGMDLAGENPADGEHSKPRRRKKAE